MLLYQKEGVSKVPIVTDDTPSLDLSHYIFMASWAIPLSFPVVCSCLPYENTSKT